MLSCTPLAIALSWYNLVMHVRRERMSSKDCSHAKLTKVWQNGKAKFLPEYHVNIVGSNASLGLETNIVGLFVAIKTSKYYYYC